MLRPQLAVGDAAGVAVLDGADDLLEERERLLRLEHALLGDAVVKLAALAEGADLDPSAGPR